MEHSHTFVRLLYLVLFFVIGLSFCGGEILPYQHVALYKCDQNTKKLDLVLVAKGEAKTINDEILIVKDISIFNYLTAKIPELHSLFVVGLSRDGEGAYKMKIIWIKSDKSLEDQLKSMNLEDHVFQKLSNKINHKESDKN